jgi:hypothetical protein
VTRPTPPAEVRGSVVRVEYLKSAGDRRRDDEVPSPILPTVPAGQLKPLRVPGRVLVTGMIKAVVDLIEREILTPYLWTLHEC